MMFFTLGIGPVGLPTLASAPCVKWDEPEFMSADVTHLIYNLSVSGADSSSLNVMTNETHHCTELIPCQEYTVTVTPFSTAPDYTGNSMTITDNAPGGILIYSVEDRMINHVFISY